MNKRLLEQAGGLQPDERALLLAYADIWSDGSDAGYYLRNLNQEQTGFKTIDQWEQVMAMAVPIGYNDFNVKRVASWLRRFSTEGGPITVAAGREYSVAIYIKGPDETLNQMVKLAKRAVKADETEVQGGILRIWWD